jgi:1-acyl-sn-glycerol-3-phosphate acyltransferase
MTIAYRRNGQIDCVVPFIGDDDFVAHLCRLLRKPAARVDIMFHAPLTVSSKDNPSQIAHTLHQQVSQGLEELRAKHRRDCWYEEFPFDQKA